MTLGIKALTINIILSILALSSPTVPAAAAGVPEDGVLDFAILRDGTEIGSYVIRFAKIGDPVIVHVTAKVDYRFAFIPLYLFELAAREEWRDGRLVGMAVETNDNGDDVRVTVTSEGDSLNLSVNGEDTEIDARTIPASLWNIALVERDTILDLADGEMMNVSVRDSGDETIQVRGQAVRARHYVITGDFERDLWYDQRKVLVQVRFEGRDGSEIRYRLR
jgi:hypothetical protein